MYCNKINKVEMPVEMYRVQPFYDPGSEVQLPNVMYNVKNFHESSASVQATDTSSLDSVSALERKQERILTRLAELRQTLDELTGRYQNSQTSTESTAPTFSHTHAEHTSNVQIKSPLGSGIHDIVINADPSSPPLSVFILLEMLKLKFKVLATSYIHSSVSSVDPRLCAVIKNGCQATRGDHEIALSVVWKKVENGPELMVSAVKQSVVFGEVNIARYINRLLCPSFDTDNIVMATYWDSWLDVADLSLLNGNSKQKSSAIKNLNARLKRNDWTVGLEFSLVDVVMWSALHQSQEVSGAPEHVQKWMKTCNTMPLFKSALTLVL